MDFQFKSKFNLEDVVWFMEDNKPVQGIIETIHYQREEFVDLSCRHKSVFTRLKSFIQGAKCKVRLRYQIDMINDDGEFQSSPHYRDENEIFKSKEELLKSL
jgi:hypothetical protein